MRLEVGDVDVVESEVAGVETSQGDGVAANGVDWLIGIPVAALRMHRPSVQQIDHAHEEGRTGSAKVASCGAGHGWIFCDGASLVVSSPGFTRKAQGNHRP